VAAEKDEGFMIFDVFESQEAFDRFRAIANPIATEPAYVHLDLADPVRFGTYAGDRWADSQITPMPL
jgi:hypothetical protein